MNVKTLTSGIAIAAAATFPSHAGVVKMPLKPASSVDLAPTGKGYFAITSPDVAQSGFCAS